MYMANTYTQIHIQAIFAVQNRQSLIQKEWREELYKYITGIVQNNNHKVLQINGMPDHVHLFFGMRPSQSLSDLMKVVKGDSSEWINKKKFTKGQIFLAIRIWGLLLCQIASAQESFDTFKTRKSITEKRPLQKNTSIFWRLLK
jgi:REP element-mobilizing transposase RayT